MPTSGQTKNLLAKFNNVLKEETSCRDKISKLERKSIEITTKNFIHSSLIQKRIKQRKWKGLAETAGHKKKQLLDTINELIALNRNKSKLAEKKAVLLKPYQEVLSKPVSKQKNWAAAKDSLRDALKKNKKKPGEIKRYIDFLERFDYKKTSKVSERIIQNYHERIEAGFDRLLSAFAKEYFAHMAALVNMNELQSKTTGQIKSINKQALKLSEESFITLKKLLNSKPAQQQKTLASTYRKADAMLSKLLPVALSLYKQSISNKFTIAPLDDISIENGMVIRDLFLVLLTTKKMEFLVSNPHSKMYADWQDAGKTTTLQSKEPKAKSATIERLIKQGNKYNNTLISVKGKITRIKINHKFNKAISYAFITDGMREVRITLPHIKMDSGGMVPGSYAKVTGKWLQKNKESYNRPSLALDRVSYTTLAKSHWKSWVCLQMNKVYEPNPHSLNITHSWKPGANGAINQIKYSLI